MKNEGFSIIQIIIVIAVIGVFGGVVCPFGLRYAEQTRRMRDVYEADAIAHQFQLMISNYGGFTEGMLEGTVGDTGVLDWQREEILQASGMSEKETVAIVAESVSDGQCDLDQLLFHYLDKIPESATDPDYAWNLHFDEETGRVKNIFLVETNASGRVVTEMEVYPNYANFVALN